MRADNPGFAETAGISVLVVRSSEEDFRTLHDVFSNQKWELDEVGTIQEALSWMAQYGPPPVIICERVLPDGDWKALLHHIDTVPRMPRLIVSSRLADDHLWCEVLNLLGYDVLATPFDAQEVTHVVSCAWASWHQQWHGEKVHAKSARRAGDAVASSSRVRAAS